MDEEMMSPPLLMHKSSRKTPMKTPRAKTPQVCLSGPAMPEVCISSMQMILPSLSWCVVYYRECALWA
jgi:hypothetical protein